MKGASVSVVYFLLSGCFLEAQEADHLQLQNRFDSASIKAPEPSTLPLKLKVGESASPKNFLENSASLTKSEKSLQSLIREEILNGVKRLSDSYELNAYQYFRSLPFHPTIEVVFVSTASPYLLDESTGPRYCWDTTHFISTKEKIKAALQKIEIRIDAGLYDRLVGELDEFYDKDYFSNDQEKAKRLAFFLIPKALADLEATHLTDPLELNDYPAMDIVEEIRLMFEVGAMRRLIQEEVQALQDIRFWVLPSEVNYLEERFGKFGMHHILLPEHPYFKQRVEEKLLEDASTPSGKWWATLNFSDEGDIITTTQTIHLKISELYHLLAAEMPTLEKVIEPYGNTATFLQKRKEFSFPKIPCAFDLGPNFSATLTQNSKRS